jgi:hypothetical protein
VSRKKCRVKIIRSFATRPDFPLDIRHSTLRSRQLKPDTSHLILEHRLAVLTATRQAITQNATSCPKNCPLEICILAARPVRTRFYG